MGACFVGLARALSCVGLFAEETLSGGTLTLSQLPVSLPDPQESQDSGSMLGCPPASCHRATCPLFSLQLPQSLVSMWLELSDVRSLATLSPFSCLPLLCRLCSCPLQNMGLNCAGPLTRVVFPINTCTVSIHGCGGLAVCIDLCMPFHGRDLSICGLGVHGGVLEPILCRYRGRL